MLSCVSSAMQIGSEQKHSKRAIPRYILIRNMTGTRVTRRANKRVARSEESSENVAGNGTPTQEKTVEGRVNTEGSRTGIGEAEMEEDSGPPSVTETSNGSSDKGSETSTTMTESQEEKAGNELEEYDDSNNKDEESSVVRDSDGETIASSDIERDFLRYATEDVLKDHAWRAECQRMFMAGYKRKISTDENTLTSAENSRSNRDRHKKKKVGKTGLWLYKDTHANREQLSENMMKSQNEKEVKDYISKTVWKRYKLMNRKSLGELRKSNFIDKIAKYMKFNDIERNRFENHIAYLVLTQLGSQRSNTIRALRNKFFTKKDGVGE